MIRGAGPFVVRLQEDLSRFFRTQRAALSTGRFDQDRWNRELTPILTRHGKGTAQAFGAPVARRFGVTFDADEILEWLVTVSAITARYVNRSTAEDLVVALDEMPRADALERVFAQATGFRAAHIARSKVNTSANVGRQVAAEIGGAGSKTWIVTSKNPRSSHASLSGESAAIGSVFSNGAKWPGDPNLSVDERANCACYCDFGE